MCWLSLLLLCRQGLSKAGHGWSFSFWQVAEKAQEMVGVFSPAQLQALARAAAQAGQPLPSLVDAIGRAAVRSLGRFRVQELANLLYGIAASGNTHPGLFSAAAATLPGKLEAGDRSVKGQDIALTGVMQGFI